MTITGTTKGNAMITRNTYDNGFTIIHQDITIETMGGGYWAVNKHFENGDAELLGAWLSKADVRQLVRSL